MSPRKGRKRREPRLYRTGRNAHFSCKADPEVVDDFYAITDAEGWVLGETSMKSASALCATARLPSRGLPSRSSRFGVCAREEGWPA